MLNKMEVWYLIQSCPRWMIRNVKDKIGQLHIMVHVKRTFLIICHNHWVSLFTMWTFVGSDYAGDTITWISWTSFMIFLNSAPIYWYSKKQGSCEISSLGSEFIAMKSCCEYIRELRYKLYMTEIPVELSTFILCHNQSVLVNLSKPHSSLKKQPSSIAFHFDREGKLLRMNGMLHIWTQIWIVQILWLSRFLEKKKGPNLPHTFCNMSMSNVNVHWWTRQWNMLSNHGF